MAKKSTRALILYRFKAARKSLESCAGYLVEAAELSEGRVEGIVAQTTSIVALLGDLDKAITRMSKQFKGTGGSQIRPPASEGG